VLTDDVRELVDRARERDPDAWEMLYRRAYPRLFAYARRRVASDHAADDAVSETMTRAIDRIGAFVWRGNGFDAWLYGILRNVLCETSRARARISVGEGVVELPTDDHEPLRRVIAREEAVSVRTAFEQLSEAERELLELRVVGCLSAEDVGAVLGKRPGAVRMAQARALERLRVLLGEPA
jgi:RNA polymerase sigma-70 factor (ECF subfamily)